MMILMPFLFNSFDTGIPSPAAAAVVAADTAATNIAFTFVVLLVVITAD